MSASIWDAIRALGGQPQTAASSAQLRPVQQAPAPAPVYQGPMPAGSTPAQVQQFRNTGVTGQVLGATTGGGGGGGGGPDLSNPVKQTDYARQQGFDSWDQYQSSLQQQAPGEPNIDFDAIFRPAFEALTQQEQAARSMSEAGINEATMQTAQTKTGLQNEEANRLADFGQQRTEAQGTSDSVIQSARRQAAELLQGIQARYGGTTGTGKFQSEILGAQATQNIAQQQSALMNTLGKIGQSENQLKTEVMTLINNEDQKLETLKVNERARLQQALAQIGSERGRLESEKAQKRIDTLNQYQTLLANIEAQNLAFKQQVFMKAQEAQSKLDLLRAKAKETFKVNNTFNPADIQRFGVGNQEVATWQNPRTGSITSWKGTTEDEQTDEYGNPIPSTLSF